MLAVSFQPSTAKRFIISLSSSFPWIIERAGHHLKGFCGCGEMRAAMDEGQGTHTVGTRHQTDKPASSISRESILF
jgi:hypothetical protein